ncbi:MAG: nucleoside triphosphate pyrophosphohydrolase [Pseudomonadota bacterium]|nr:nucleoside triphosphate pyrophosphohydrolase [Pseudomonadota bacterium]
MSTIDQRLDVMARLRDPENGCPWDVEQTFATIAPYTIEEAYEVADAINDEDWPALVDELGDLLFQVVFYAQMAREAGRFDFSAIAAGAVDKMVRRHPHVFEDSEIATAEAQTHAWEAHKAEERGAKAEAEGRAPSALDGVTRALPALIRAIKLQNRAARVGFDWPTLPPVIHKIEEEIAEVRGELSDGATPDRLADEIGDLLFACVNLARHAGVDPEAALRQGNTKFERRFRRIEARLAEDGRGPDDSDLAEMDRLWDRAKAEEPGK